MADKGEALKKAQEEQEKELAKVKESFKKIKDTEAMKYLMKYFDESEERMIRIAMERSTAQDAAPLDDSMCMTFIQRSAALRHTKELIERLSK